MESTPKYSSSGDRDEPTSTVCEQGPAGLPLPQEPVDDTSAETEKCHESAYRCSRVGHAGCQPDLRSDRQQPDLWRLRLGTELPLLRFQSITPLCEDFRFKPTRWLDYAAGWVPAA